MKAVQAVMAWMILLLVCAPAFAQNSVTSPEALRAMLQAKKVFIVSGHVRHWKTKGLVKKELVDETPFEEPCRKELEKWGRFTLVSDIKDADLVIRAYEKGKSEYVPMISPGVTGGVTIGHGDFILDVWQPSSKKVIWSASKNVGTSWSTHTGIANLVKKLREYMEEQEKSAPPTDSVSKANSANPQN